MSHAAQDLIDRLLCVDRKKRLGSRGGAAELKAHEFFKEVKWESLLGDEGAVFVPHLESPDDTSYFDQERQGPVSVVSQDDSSSATNTASKASPATGSAIPSKKRVVPALGNSQHVKFEGDCGSVGTCTEPEPDGSTSSSKPDLAGSYEDLEDEDSKFLNSPPTSPLASPCPILPSPPPGVLTKSSSGTSMAVAAAATQKIMRTNSRNTNPGKVSPTVCGVPSSRWRKTAMAPPASTRSSGRGCAAEYDAEDDPQQIFLNFSSTNLPNLQFLTRERAKVSAATAANRKPPQPPPQ